MADLPWQVCTFLALLFTVAAWERLPDTWRHDVMSGPAGPAVRIGFWIVAMLVYGSLLP